MGEYTIIALLAVFAVITVELRVLHTDLLRTRPYWIAMAICYAFMIAVNGWLTKLTAPIVVYDSDAVTGWRLPWDIPVEDYLFGYALLTLAMLLWDAAAGRRSPIRPAKATVSSTAPTTARETAS
jgi:lycopene cyclase domain-containing protein